MACKYIAKQITVILSTMLLCMKVAKELLLFVKYA